jgi:hypothetical protein
MASIMHRTTATVSCLLLQFHWYLLLLAQIVVACTWKLSYAMNIPVAGNIPDAWSSTQVDISKPGSTNSNIYQLGHSSNDNVGGWFF